MKIVMLCDFYSENYQYQESYLSKYYLKLGHSVTVIASNFEDIKKYYLNKYDKNIGSTCIEINKSYKVFHLKYKLNIFNKIRNFKNVLQILLDEKPELIYCHGIHFNLHEAVRYKKLNFSCRIIMDYHGDFSNSGKNWISIYILHKIIRKIYLLHYLKYIDVIYPITPSSKKFLEVIYGLKQKVGEVLPLGIDFDKSMSVLKTNRRFEIRKEYNVCLDDIIIINVGKQYAYKKTEQLIAAVNKIDSKKIHLFIIGDALGNESYSQLLINTAGENKNIHFLGWKSGDEILEYMAASDLAIYPASQSMLWQQSLGMGLGLIVGKFIHINGKEIEQDTEYLNFYDNLITLNEKGHKIDEIECIVRYFIDNPKQLEKIKKNAHKVAKEILNYEKIAKRTLGMVDDIPENSSPDINL